MIDKIVDPKREKRKEQNQYIALQLTLVNVYNRIDSDDVYSFIEANLSNIQTYWMDPERLKGKRVFASVDYFLLLSTAASVVTIADILWKAYDKFIRSRKNSPKDDAGINIAFKLPNGTITSFWIGNEYKDKDIFIEAFIDCIEELKQNSDNFHVAIDIKSDIESSKYWVRRK